MKYGYDFGDAAYADCRIVKAKKHYVCEGITTEATEEDHEGEGPTWDAYGRADSEHCTDINPGDVYVYQFDLVEGEVATSHCCINCALEFGVVVRVG